MVRKLSHPASSWTIYIFHLISPRVSAYDDLLDDNLKAL